MTETPDQYRKGAKQKIVQHEYREGYVVWNWLTKKWDYHVQAIEKLNNGKIEAVRGTMCR